MQVIAIEKHKILKIIDDLNFLGIKYITLGEGWLRLKLSARTNGGICWTNDIRSSKK